MVLCKYSAHQKEVATIRKSLLDFIKRADILLLVICVTSSIIGIAIVASASASYSNSGRLIAVQTGAFLLGIAAYLLLTVLDIGIIAEKWPVLVVFNVLFLLSLRVWGDARGGNLGWINLGIISVQPTEIVKFTYIVILAKHISYLKSYKNLDSFFSVAQLALHFLLTFGLVIMTAQDLGSSLVFFFAFIVMLFVAGLKLYWFAVGFAAIAAAIPFLVTHVLQEYQIQRILAPYVASIDPAGTDVNWQLRNSQIALASGRLRGYGLFNGPQSQSDAIPEKHNDFIFAVAGEELGMIGCVVILLLLLTIVIRCAYVGVNSKNTMNMLICFGIGSTVFFQTFENIGMCIGLTPVIGITLPFFSYGGSSLASALAAMGIVSGIRYRRKPERFHQY